MIGNLVQWAQDLPLSKPFDNRVAEPEGAEETGIGGQKDLLHPQQLGQPAGVLAASTTEGNQRETGRVDALANRNVANGLGHALVGDPQQPLENLLVAAGPAIDSLQLQPELLKRVFRRLEIDWNREIARQPAGREAD